MPLPSPETSPANAGGFEQPTRRGSPVGDPSAAASGPIASRTGLFSDDFSEDTFWRNDTRRDAAHEPTPPPSPGELPARADVVIVGSGYTGLHAAIQTARAGRDTVVLEAGEPGGGCSTRNGGQISTSIKPSLEALTRRFGAERARAIRGEGVAALDWTEDFVRSEAIDCDFRRAGRFHGAHTPASYERLAREAELGMRREGIEAFAVPRAEQRGQLGSDLYHGGVVYPRFATLHPGRYHRGLLDAARAAGVRIVAGCRAERIDDARRGGPGGGTGDVTVHSSLGAIRCRDLAIATNGYTGELLPWLQRRVIPIGSYVIATEELPAGTVDALFPSARIATDTRRVVYYYGPTPDRRRVVFGGRVSTGETDPKISGPRLHAEMVRIFPELAGSRIAHPAIDALPCTDLPLQEGTPLMLGSVRIDPLFTPGHTDGHHAYRLGERVLTGDALLIDACGRTDFQSGDATTLYQSVTGKLFTLPDETLVYPGHDYEGRWVSSIAQEKTRNPRLGGERPLAEFVELMDNLNLAYPKFIDFAVPGNRACGECPPGVPDHLQQYCEQIGESRQG